jgi:hypothetical protein
LEWILPGNHNFQGRERLILFQICLFMWVEETQVSLERKPSMLEATADSTLFPCENWASFWKEYFLKLMGFMVDIGSVYSKLAY